MFSSISSRSKAIQCGKAALNKGLRSVMRVHGETWIDSDEQPIPTCGLCKASGKRRFNRSNLQPSCQTIRHSHNLFLNLTFNQIGVRTLSRGSDPGTVTDAWRRTGLCLGDSKCAFSAISHYSVSCCSPLRLIPMLRSRSESGSVARCTGPTATAILLLSAPMVTTATIPTLARPTGITDRRGSKAASLSGPALGIAVTDMDIAACTAIAATAMGTDTTVMAMG